MGKIELASWIFSFFFQWHSHSGSIGINGLGRVHGSPSLPRGTVPIAGTIQPEISDWAFGSHIVRFSHPRHNEFANGVAAK
jgi:hypothetical protein